MNHSVHSVFKYKNCIDAIIHNDLHELQRMYAAKYEINCLFNADDNPLEIAVQKANLLLLDWLYNNVCKQVINSPFAKRRILEAQYENLLYAFHHNLIHPNQNLWLMIRAIKNNDVQWFQAIFNKYGIWPKTITSELAAHGHLLLLQYAVDNHCQWDINTTAEAAKNDHFDCLKYAHEHGCPWHPDTAYWAACIGSLRCLQYVYEHNFTNRLNVDVLYVAAISGHVECLNYVHKVAKIKWDFNCTLDVVAKDHVEILRYAYYNQCEWHPDTILEAVNNLSIRCFTFCFEICQDKTQFWCSDYNCMLNKISFDHPVWRQLFLLDLRAHPKLQKKVYQTQQHIKLLADYTLYLMSSFVNSDVIHYCIISYY
jgi:hypothetical protein